MLAGVIAAVLGCLLWGVVLPSLARAQEAVRVELEAITVDPPDREAELLVWRHLPLRVGQLIDSNVLVEARDQLVSTGLFTDVDIYTTRGSRPGSVIAIVAATPSHRLHLETGLGFEPLRGWYLNIIGVRRTGLFHRGGTARLSFRSGIRTSGLYGELQVPGLIADDLDLLLNLDRFDEYWDLYDRDKPYHQVLDRSRALIGVRGRLGPELSLTVRAGFTRTAANDSLDAFDDTPSIPAESLLPVQKNPLHFFNLEAEVVKDRLDRLRPWQHGSWSALALRGATSNRGPAFWGAELDARVARPVARTRAAAFRFRAVFTDPGTPYFQRPVVGGVGSLRGFSGAALSGPLGARALWQTSAEWRQPLAGSDPRRPRVIGTAFVDVGDHWTAEGKRFGLSSSVGYGAYFRVRWIETINLEVAYPLSKDPKHSPVNVNISLGRSF